MKVNEFYCGWLWPRHLDWERSQYRLDVLPIAVDYPYRAPYAYAEYVLYEPKHLEEA